MLHRILILILVSPAFAFYLQDIEPGLHAGPSRAQASVNAAGEETDDFFYGECQCSEAGDDGGRYPGAFFLAFTARKTVKGRCGSGVSPKRGPGPVLSALADSLILGRPPPADSGNT